MQSTIARRLTILMLAFVVAACGFHLRGVADLAFSKLYMKGSASISKDLISALKTNGVKIVTEPEEAEVMLELMSDGVEKRILSLGGTGSVREFELFYRIKFRVRDASEELWGQEQIIESRRDFSYLDTELLAKSYEEAMLYEDMRRDATRELMRRLVAQKPKAKAVK
ncbi:LPS assembly lipoprotein LptE [Candidatus Methylopumilus turicensis]|jgi:LPS-assembly lipoprotein|uniref:LPS-assembly lipoprotein LptE n=1 Tax=Candidatus Methylopumilus turicensis TaxID=1581680 RepID=A0A0B7ISX8_9PROT|nr:LPS assembly lipoprotein LptE [Candidatus Methylopumilus turicensis]CEN55449.1 Rare lipoprotein B [Candidatus Methylopumilus turicensis]